MLSPGPRFPRPAARSLLPAPCSHLSGLGPRVSNLRSGPGLGLRLDLRNRLSGFQVSRRCTRPSALCSWSSTLAYRSTALAASPWSLSTDSGSKRVIHGSNPLAATPRKGEPPPTDPTPDLSRLQASPQSDDRRRSQHPPRMSCPVRGAAIDSAWSPARTPRHDPATHAFRTKPLSSLPRAAPEDTRARCNRPRAPLRAAATAPPRLRPLPAPPARVRSSPVKPQRPPAPLVLELFHVKQARHPEGSSRRRAPRSSTSANSCSRR